MNGEDRWWMRDTSAMDHLDAFYRATKGNIDGYL